QVFGINDIGIHDNFFDLGGHSLKAAQLFYLIERAYGRHLPLSMLFQAPTIASLTSLLTQDQRASPWQFLVAMQLRESGLPIFMVPGVDGNVIWFAQLAKFLGQAHPVYGLQARGVDGKAEPFGSIQEMATHYVAEIRTCLPQGPYIIVGACIGGLVAYEIAQQLVKQGAVVTLIIINSWLPTSYSSYKHRYGFLTGLTVPLGILSKTMSAFGGFRHMPMKDWWLVVRRKIGTLLSLFRRPPHSDLGRRQRKRVERAMFQAAANYAVHRYPGHILTFVASQRIDPQDTRYAWRELADGGCQTVEVAARRTGDLVLSPHVEEISSHIRRYIAEYFLDKPIRPSDKAA
ncbi:MAG: hypothetical protein HP496_16210, partial [Nitrospira sp.]|nr:hypothetical protein [Nitrospira sp.]